MPKYIDADALRASALKATKSSDLAFDNCFPYWQFAKCIKQAPTAEVVPVIRGEWQCRYDYGTGETDVTCSNCMDTRTINGCYETSSGESCYDEDNFCPNCGANMRGGDVAHTVETNNDDIDSKIVTISKSNMEKLTHLIKESYELSNELPNLTRDIVNTNINYRLWILNNWVENPQEDIIE